MILNRHFFPGGPGRRGHILRSLCYVCINSYISFLSNWHQIHKFLKASNMLSRISHTTGVKLVQVQGHQKTPNSMLNETFQMYPWEKYISKLVKESTSFLLMNARLSKKSSVWEFINLQTRQIHQQYPQESLLLQGPIFPMD